MIKARWVGKIVLEMDVPEDVATVEEVSNILNEEFSKDVKDLFEYELEGHGKVTIETLNTRVEKV